jgi:hypothetical protein
MPFIPRVPGANWTCHGNYWTSVPEPVFWEFYKEQKYELQKIGITVRREGSNRYHSYHVRYDPIPKLTVKKVIEAIGDEEGVRFVRWQTEQAAELAKVASGA